MKNANCPFCKLMYGPDQMMDDWFVQGNDEHIAVRDLYPVTDGHTLIIPRRHMETPFDMYGDETMALLRLLKQQQIWLMAEDPTIDGFNIGFNAGFSAGQTVPHAHCHLIPRRLGDVDDPIGGIRNVIPGKGNYKL